MRMRCLSVFVLSACLMAFFPPAAQGQAGGMGGGAAAQPMGAPVPSNAKVLPEVNFNETSLEDVVAFLREVDPTLKVMLVRDDGASPNYGAVTLKMKNVTAMDVLNLISAAYPMVRLGQIPGEAGASMVVIRVATDDRASGPEVFVRAYNLTSVMKAVAKSGPPGNAAESDKAALNEVLSLVQAMLDQSDDTRKATLQIHEPTHMLIVKGTSKQLSEIQQAIEAISPTVTRENVRELASAAALSEVNGVMGQMKADMEREMIREFRQMQQNAATQPSPAK